MDKLYIKCRQFWDGVFREEAAEIPTGPDLGIPMLDSALTWLCDGAQKVLDFGCGNGSLLFRCALRGTQVHRGIDFSSEAVGLAQKRAALMNRGRYIFSVGEVSALKPIGNGSMDAALLSNILDNLIPQDSEALLNHVRRILRPGGKLLVKLNDYMTEERMTEWDVKRIEGDLLDDGLLLYNRTTEDWEEALEKRFHIERFHEIYYPQQDQYNRLFLLRG